MWRGQAEPRPGGAPGAAAAKGDAGEEHGRGAVSGVEGGRRLGREGDRRATMQLNQQLQRLNRIHPDTTNNYTKQRVLRRTTIQNNY